jgi:hypothetical protein
MKQLIINGNLALIDINQYFPFTYKISDLEEINIINFPSTKTVELPRNSQNDEIFGHIAEITRINYGYEDNNSGVSFNQFKKAQYVLLNNSVVVSEGILRIVNITNDKYEVELYDLAIELLEELEDKQLNELEIINPQTNKPLNERINHITLKDMATKDYGVTPVFVDFDSKYTGTQIYGRRKTDKSSVEEILELPTEMTPLKMKTFSAAEVPLTIHITKLIDMIEAKEQIEFSSEVKGLLAYMHMLLKKPENSLISTETVLKSSEATHKRYEEAYPTSSSFNLENLNGSRFRIHNGNHLLKNDFEFTFITNGAQVNGNIVSNYKGETFTSDTPNGTLVGTLGVTSQIILSTKEDGSGSYFIPQVFTKVPMLMGDNTTYKKIGSVGYLTVKGTLVLNNNMYPKLKAGATARVTTSITDEVDGNKTYIFNYTFDYTIDSVNNPKIIHKPLDFTEYDILDSKKILPKISIKDFVINMAKIFNFDISIRNKKLFIDIKRYYMSSEPLLLADELDIDVSKVNFSRLEIKSEVVESDLLKQYEEEHGTWGSKIINTGYSIKKEEEEVELPYGTPVALIDYGYFAYNQFGAYLNGGYNKYPVGVITGLGDGMVLGYVGINDEKMYVTDAEIVDDKFVISNRRLYYDSLSGTIEWTFDDKVTGVNVSTLDRYSTFLPYRFRDGNIIESLEVNKPHYNFANITDAQYPDSVTLYDRYHKKMLEDKYSANTHVLTGKMFIDGLSDTNKIYNYRNSNYIISELMEYDPTEPNMYEVKLMRVNNVENYTIPPKQII